MCGIAGVVRPRDENAIGAMTDRIRHRGPDDSGVWTSPDGTVALGHRRLSILDLSPLGRNPMTRGQQGLWLTYNGEAYNFRKVRRELEGLGDRFISQTDTEVLLAAYARWGVDCLEKFVGMFAFAIWDEPRKRLFLARDRVGKKPLYYSDYLGRFAFGSELKCLLADPDFPTDVDRDAVSLYLKYGYVPAPLSIFRAARKLPPGHYALYEQGRLRIEKYWDPLPFALGPRYDRGADAAESDLHELLRDSVAGRMISDVPLGAFLSGGIDSSLVVALMQEQSARPVKTFTIRFENPEHNEADHAAAVARHLGTEHYEETCGVSEMLDIVDVLPDFFDEPFADPSAIPTYLVSKITRRHVTVALSGDGGDELFFGYGRYERYAATRRLMESPRFLRRGLARVADTVPGARFARAAEALREDDPDRYARFVSWWTDPEIRRLTGRPVPESSAYADTLRRIQGLPAEERPPVLDLLTYLPDDILAKVDRASMAVALEARAPLLDHRIVEFALALPQRLKSSGGTSKWLLRQILYRKVPRELVDRPKMGFGVPMADWLKGPLRARMAEYLASGDLETLGIDSDVAAEAWMEFLSDGHRGPNLMWNLFSLVQWSRRWRDPARATEAMGEITSSDSRRVATATS